MIHVEKTVEKKENKSKVIDTPTEETIKEVKVKEEKVIEKPIKKPIQKKEKEVVDKYNGLHAYALTAMPNNVQNGVSNIAQHAIVVARTEETAKNRIQKEYPNLKIMSLKRIPDVEGHKILKRVRNKAGIFFEEK